MGSDQNICGKNSGNNRLVYEKKITYGSSSVSYFNYNVLGHAEHPKCNMPCRRNIYFMIHFHYIADPYIEHVNFHFYSSWCDSKCYIKPL